MTRIRKGAITLGVVFLLGAMQTGFAQQNLKIGYVNVPFLLQNAPQTMAMEQRMQTEFAPRQAELQALAEELTEQVERFERDSSVMGEGEREELRRQIEQGDRDLQRRQTVLQEDAQIRQNELLAQLQNDIGLEVQAYVEEEGYDLILSEVVYFSEAVDITQDVLQAISADFSVE